MKREPFKLYNTNERGLYRSLIKTAHGRILYLELKEDNSVFSVNKCYYVDRVRGGQYYSAPQRFTTKSFNYNDMISVIAEELDRRFYGIEFVNSSELMTTEEFIQYKLSEMKRGYKFLIFCGEGNMIDGIPYKITTRLKNRIHRSIYLCIRYYSNDKGVIESCFYYDRKYKARTKVIPQMLTSVFVDYNRNAIIETVNRELNCDFTDIIFITDNSVDAENNETALCGNI